MAIYMLNIHSHFAVPLTWYTAAHVHRGKRKEAFKESKIVQTICIRSYIHRYSFINQIYVQFSQTRFVCQKKSNIRITPIHFICYSLLLFVWLFVCLFACLFVSLFVCVRVRVCLCAFVSCFCPMALRSLSVSSATDVTWSYQCRYFVP